MQNLKDYIIPILVGVCFPLFFWAWSLLEKWVERKAKEMASEEFMRALKEIGALKDEIGGLRQKLTETVASKDEKFKDEILKLLDKLEKRVEKCEDKISDFIEDTIKNIFRTK